MFRIARTKRNRPIVKGQAQAVAIFLASLLVPMFTGTELGPEQLHGSDGPDEEMRTRVSGLMEEGTALFQAGRYAEAAESLRTALEQVRKQYGIDTLEWWFAANGLGVALHHSGDHIGAKHVLERALAVVEAELGPDHLNTAQSLNSCDFPGT